ncbi:MAG: methyltransferase [Candidatus Micrarchaeota archaeon]|nr:methyltransferase [Candidatus Micrarchaeota archaeon]
MECEFGGISLYVAPGVYEPAEDSFMLASYACRIRGGRKILDVGCGCGIASIAAAKADGANVVFGADINPSAVECARRNAASNKAANASFFISDLFCAIAPGEKFDFILFNPPYLPTGQDEKLARFEENAAYDGGESGLEVFFRFSASVADRLAKGGRVAVVATSLGGGIERVACELEGRVGRARILSQERFFFETIALVEASMR